jgi:nucleotide-binding universal stress UspA family protein
MHRTIVVAASQGQPLRDAFALGIDLARPRGAEVVVARVVVGPADPAPELDALLQSPPQDVPVSSTVVSARSIAEGLHEVALEREADLLVMGSSHVGTADRALRGDFTLEVIRDGAPCAIAVAPQGYASREHHAARVVGVAWNGSQESNEALEWAVQFAERTAAALRLVYVAEPFEAHFRRDAELEELRRAAERRVPATIDIAVGDDPAEELLRFDDLDLMVMGSRANGALRRAAVGSVSSQVFHRAAYPVVILARGVHAPMETTA